MWRTANSVQTKLQTDRVNCRGASLLKIRGRYTITHDNNNTFSQWTFEN